MLYVGGSKRVNRKVVGDRNRRIGRVDDRDVIGRALYSTNHVSRAVERHILCAVAVEDESVGLDDGSIDLRSSACGRVTVAERQRAASCINLRTGNLLIDGSGDFKVVVLAGVEVGTASPIDDIARGGLYKIAGDLVRIDLAAGLDDIGLNFVGGELAATLLLERLGGELALNFYFTAVLDELLASIGRDLEVALGGELVGGSASLAVEGDILAGRGGDRAALSRYIALQREASSALDIQLVKIGELTSFRRRELVVAAAKVKANLLDVARAGIVDVALDGARTGLVSGVVERHGVVITGRGDDLRSLGDIEAAIGICLGEDNLDGRNRSVGGGRLFGIALEVGADLDGTFGGDIDIDVCRDIAGNIHTGALAAELVVGGLLTGNLSDACSVLREGDAAVGVDRGAILDRDVLVGGGGYIATRGDGAGLDLGGLLTNEPDIASRGDIGINLDGLAVVDGFELDVAACRLERCVDVDIATGIHFDGVGGDGGVVLDEAVERVGLEVAGDGQIAGDLDLLDGVDLKLLGESAHDICLAGGGGAGVEADGAARDGVDLDEIAGADNDIATELEVVRIDGSVDLDRLAEEERIVNDLAALDDDAADGRTDLYGRRRISNHCVRVVDTCGDCAEEASDIDDGTIADQDAVGVEDIDVCGVRTVQGALDGSLSTSRVYDVVERAADDQTEVHLRTNRYIELCPVEYADIASRSDIDVKDCRIGSSGRI